MKISYVKTLPLLLVLALTTTKSVFCQQAADKNNPIKEERKVQGFNSIHAAGLAVVYIRESIHENATIEVGGMPLEDLILSVEDSVLEISTKGSHNGETVNVYVNYRTLNNIEVRGAATLTSLNTLKGTTLDVLVDDAGDATLNVAVDKVNIALKEAGNLKITGKANRQDIRSIGEEGTLDNKGLTVGKL
jgi:hypothetical protein